MDFLLGIDAGTTSVKAAIFAADGRCLGIGRKEYQLDTPAADQVQLDPNVYWQACVQTVNEAVKQAGINSDQIQGLSVSSQGETIITLDAHGNPIYPALVWFDNRALPQANKLARKFNKLSLIHI